MFDGCHLKYSSSFRENREMYLLAKKPQGSRRRHLQMFFKIGAFAKFFAKFCTIHKCWKLFLLKFVIKKILQHRLFPVNIANILRTTFLFREHLLWLLPGLFLWIIARSKSQYFSKTGVIILLLLSWNKLSSRMNLIFFIMTVMVSN